jgi:hypothetical protein
MQGMISALLLFLGFRLRRAACAILQEFLRFQAEALNVGVYPGPFFAKELLAFALE